MLVKQTNVFFCHSLVPLCPCNFATWLVKWIPTRSRLDDTHLFYLFARLQRQQWSWIAYKRCPSLSHFVSLFLSLSLTHTHAHCLCLSICLSSFLSQTHRRTPSLSVCLSHFLSLSHTLTHSITIYLSDSHPIESVRTRRQMEFHLCWW